MQHCLHGLASLRTLLPASGKEDNTCNTCDLQMRAVTQKGAVRHKCKKACYLPGDARDQHAVSDTSMICSLSAHSRTVHHST
jgi:hypothetical protein